MARRIHHVDPPLDFLGKVSEFADKVEAALPLDPPEHDVDHLMSATDPHPVALVCSCGKWRGTVSEA